MMKAAQFQIAGVDFPECPARESLRAAQAKLKAAKVHAEECREAVERGDNYLAGLEAQVPMQKCWTNRKQSSARELFPPMTTLTSFLMRRLLHGAAARSKTRSKAHGRPLAR
jgi:hypothetical protein